MPRQDDRNPFENEILDIIPERFDADPDSRHARRGAYMRIVISVAVGLLALAALGVAVRHVFYGESGPMPQQAGVPVINADERPIKTRPDDRGGLQVPDQDKLVYQRVGGGDAESQGEKLLPPPESPQAPPRPAAQLPADQHAPAIVPAFQAPPRDAARPSPGGEALTAPAAAPPGGNMAMAPAMTNPAPSAMSPVKPSAMSPVKPTTQMAAMPKAMPHKSETGKSETGKSETGKTETGAGSMAGGSWLVQLAALRSEADAKTAWVHLSAANKDLLGGLSPNIMRVDLGEKGIYYRLRAGPLDEGRARTLCGALAKRGQGCILAAK